MTESRARPARPAPEAQSAAAQPTTGPPEEAGANDSAPGGGPTPPLGEPAQPHSLAYLYPVSFLSGTIIIALGPILDPVLRDLDIPLSLGGLLAAGFAGGRVVGLLLLNMGLARVPLKWLVVGGATAQAVGLTLASLTGTLWSLLAALAVVGLAATIPVVVPAIWVGTYAKRTAERAMTLTLIFFAAGVLATPLAIGVALALGASWRWILAGEAVFALLTAIAFLAVPLADVPGRVNIRLPQFRELLRFDPRLLGVVLGAMFLYIGAEHILNIWLAEFQIETFGVGQGAAALALTLFFGGMMGGRFVTVPLTRKFVASRILAVSGLLMAFFAVLTAMAPTFAVSELTIFLAGVGASPSYPLLSSYINRFPVKYSGLVYSLITLAVIVSGALFAYVVGPAAEALGMRPALALSAAPALGLVLLTFFLPKKPLSSSST